MTNKEDKQTSHKLTLRQRFERWLGNLIWGQLKMRLNGFKLR